MANTAKVIIREMVNNGLVEFNTFTNEHEVAVSNQDCAQFLSENCISEKEIIGQDTYIFNDGSYITKLEDEYFVGDNIDLFEIEDLKNENI